MYKYTLYHEEGLLDPYGYLDAKFILENTVFKANITIVRAGNNFQASFLHYLCSFSLDYKCLESESSQMAKTEVKKIENWLLSKYADGELPNLYSKDEVSHALVSICVYNDISCIKKRLDNYASKESYNIECIHSFNLDHICAAGELGKESL